MIFLDKTVPKFAPEQRGYRRFVILSAPRTGSSYLASLLRSHPHIICFSELFHPQRVVLGPDHRLVAAQELLEYRRRNASAFYHDVLHARYGSEVKAVGFKLLYQQARTPDEHVIWKEMYRDRNLHVVHLTRQDYLGQIVSVAQRNLAGEWTSTDTARKEPVSVTLRPEYCELFFRNAQRAAARHREIFSGHPYIEIDYEEVAADTASVLGRLQAFLGVEPQELSSPLKRQNNHPPQRCVDNYAELARHFLDSPWAGLFR